MNLVMAGVLIYPMWDLYSIEPNIYFLKVRYAVYWVRGSLHSQDVAFHKRRRHGSVPHPRPEALGPIRKVITG